ncbi:MAG: anhydro-N-acetylmuramic acid kinase [Candidatus Nitrotoga sp.]
MQKSNLYIGIMSGTSLDGIDVALVDFSASQPELIASHYLAYTPMLQADLLALHQPDFNELHQAQLIGNQLAYLYATATADLLKKVRYQADQIGAIGCHGQTIRHRPDQRYTIQLGNAALLAELSGITVVSDFRSRDIAAGGQGAPLVPAFHHQVLRHPTVHRVIVNIGGISNLTNLQPDHATTGFDCGPGNLLMDAWIKSQHGVPFDRGGEWATSGAVIPELLHKLLSEPFFHTLPPRSSGRDLFNMEWLHSKLAGNEAPTDVQATLLALTSHSIAEAIKQYCNGVREIYLCGGGAHNHALVKQLKLALPNTQVLLTDVLGIEADWMEAIAFAWLAQQTLTGQCANLPDVTGARHPCILGAIYKA